MTTLGKDIKSALHDALHDALAEQVGEERYRLWFGPNTRLVLNGLLLVVEAATPFYHDWLRANFRTALERAATAVAGEPVEVRFRVNPELAEAAEVADSDAGVSAALDASSGAAKSRSDSPLDASPRANGSAVGGSSRRVSQQDNSACEPQRRNYADFDSFVVGHTNRLANASASMVADSPGCLTPLYLHGATGVGKTHLLESIWTSIRQSQPRCRALLLGAEQFTSLFLEALHHSGLPNFRRKYRNVELLILDDVQFFVGKKATLSELLHTVESLLRNGRQVVLAADRPPVELPGLEPELVSRFSGGMVCKLETPDQPTRREIVRRYVQRKQSTIPDEVQEMVASRLSDNTRELFGALNLLHATTQATGQPLTAASAEEALADLILSSSRAVQLPDIERAVCDVFGLRPESLQSARKIKSVSHPRMLAMWLARKHTRSALSEIGDYFGNRSHATVISANKRVNGWMTSGDHLQLADHQCHVEDAIRRIEARIRASSCG